MTPARFPTLRQDGSFCIEVVLRVEVDAQSEFTLRVREWFEDWLEKNQSYQWFGENVRYSDEFDGGPFELDCSGGQLSFRLQGLPGAKRWKDILVLKLLKDLQSAFAEVKGTERIGDCPGASAPRTNG